MIAPRKDRTELARDGSAAHRPRRRADAAEYQRMNREKASATWDATMAIMTGKGEAAVVAPFLTRARANARRLSKVGMS
jgi:hypothetical protein